MNPVWHLLCVTLAQQFLDSTKGQRGSLTDEPEWATQFIHEKELSGHFARLVRQIGSGPSVRVYGVRITVQIEPENETWQEFNLRMDKHPGIMNPGGSK